MNLTRSSIAGQDADLTVENTSRNVRSASRHAWTEAPNGLDVLIRRCSLAAAVVMFFIMISVFVSRFFGS